jgi:hypothetical protein
MQHTFMVNDFARGHMIWQCAVDACSSAGAYLDVCGAASALCPYAPAAVNLDRHKGRVGRPAVAAGSSNSPEQVAELRHVDTGPGHWRRQCCWVDLHTPAVMQGTCVTCGRGSPCMLSER